MTQEKSPRQLSMLSVLGLEERNLHPLQDTPKRRRKRKSINLLKGGSSQTQAWAEKALSDGTVELRKANYQVDDSQAKKRLEHSRWPQFDIGSAELGFGRQVTAPCGCIGKIDSNGYFFHLRKCGQSDCHAFQSAKSDGSESIRRKWQGELSQQAGEIIKGLGIEDITTDVIPWKRSLASRILRGDFQEEDLGRLIRGPEGHPHLVTRVKVPDSDTFVDANTPWETKTIIAGIRLPD